MKTAEDWIREQASTTPRDGSMEHKIMSDAVRAIQADALREAAEMANSYAKKMDHSTAAFHCVVEIRDLIRSRIREVCS